MWVSRVVGSSMDIEMIDDDGALARSIFFLVKAYTNIPNPMNTITRHIGA